MGITINDNRNKAIFTKLKECNNIDMLKYTPTFVIYYRKFVIFSLCDSGKTFALFRRIIQEEGIMFNRKYICDNYKAKDCVSLYVVKHYDKNILIKRELMGNE